MKRTTSLAPFAVGAVTLAAALGALSCAPGPALFVHTARVGQTSQQELGKPVSFQSITQPEQAGHARPGYSLLRSQQDWDLFFADHAQPVRSRSIDFNQVTVLAAYADDINASRLETTQVIDSGSALHVYMREVFPGDACPGHSGDRAFELLTIPAGNKAVHVHVDSVQGEACGRTVGATLSCHPTQEAKWQTGDITTKVGDVVECKATIMAGARLMVDRSWILMEAPKGSTTKLQFQNDGTLVRFPLDVFGRYRVRVEAADEDNKRGIAQAVIDAQVPEGTHVEASWSNFEASADPSSFPKVELHAVSAAGGGSGARIGGRDCSAAAGVDRPSWCDVQSHSAATLLGLRKDPPGRYAVSVRYLSERPENGPALCVRTISGGAVVTEGCDSNARKQGAVWQLGTLDEASGGFDGHAVVTDKGVANIEVGQPLNPELLALPDLERRYVAHYFADAQPAEGFRVGATMSASAAAVAPEIWAILDGGPYVEWDRKFGPGPAPPALAKAAVVAARAGLKVKMLIIESPRVTTRSGLGVGSTLADITSKLGPKAPFQVPALFGKDECAVSDGNIRFTFVTCDDAKNGGRVTRIVMGTK